MNKKEVEGAPLQEKDATPEVAAANVGVKEEAPHPAPQKEELTQEEQAQRMKMYIAQQLSDREEELDGILKELEEAGFGEHVYGEEGTVQVPGRLFAYLLNFMVAVRVHNRNIKQVFDGIADANNSLNLDATTFQIELTKLHKEACETGVTLSKEQVDQMKAEKNIQEIPSSKEGRKKARGSEEADERPASVDASEEE